MKPHLLFWLWLALILARSEVGFCKDAPATFTHGVASGDPDRDSILLWTRLLPAVATQRVNLKWEVSQDESFTQLVSSGDTLAERKNDFCTKVIAKNLEPGTSYYYRFNTGKIYSPIGRTKTLPEKTTHIRIGVANCAKYTGGYYHAYRSLAEIDDLDVVIHLGDYIYENGAAKPGDSYYESVRRTGRQHNPPRHCVSLNDYRTRYAQYRSDPDLQMLHARYPMINIWDDHEIAAIPKEKLPDGSPNYQGEWKQQFNDSLQAWHEWIPSRVERGEPIYRSFHFGQLINLLMVDTRVCCKSSVTKTAESLKNPDRHIVGEQQLDWLFKDILTQKAQWNVMGNQLLVAIKDEGWNRWPGFPVDRNRLLKFFENNPAINFLVTTGNAHNPHHYIVRNIANKSTLFHEVLPGSISSGNNAEKAHFDAGELEKIETRQNSMDNLLWRNNNAHGFIVLDITPKRIQVEWHFVSSIRKKTFTKSIARTFMIHPKVGD